MLETNAGHGRRQRRPSRNRRGFARFVIWAAALLAIISAVAGVVTWVATPDQPGKDDESSSELADAAPGRSASANYDDVGALESVTVHTENGDKTFKIIGKPVAWSKIDKAAAREIREEHCPDGYVFPGNTAQGNAFDKDPQIESSQQGLDYIQQQNVCNTAYLAGFNNFNDYEAMMTPSETNKYSRDIFDDKSGGKWAEAIKKTNDDVKLVALVDVQEPAETLGAIPAADVSQPWTYTKWGDRPVVGKAMAVVLMNGETRIYRASCGGQMTALKFVNVPQPVVPVASTPQPQCQGPGCVPIVPPPPPPPPPPVCVDCPPPPPPPPPPCDQPCCEGPCPPPPPEKDYGNGPEPYLPPQIPFTPLPVDPELEEAEVPDEAPPGPTYTPPAPLPPVWKPPASGGPTPTQAPTPGPVETGAGSGEAGTPGAGNGDNGGNAGDPGLDNF